ncbi:SdrD B-like domain-containing protein [Tundrisphaera sp. TA3]|uniref:SdrD B-like domain-containing protein n=1 Tax=Tundrisphaera sp. TA3 TaxID=3435775 RepID=UPI003EB7B154
MLVSSRRVAPKTSPRRPLRRPLRPGVEAIERRTLMAANFLQGVSFVDNNANNALDAGDAPRPGMTIQLRDAATNALLNSTLTNAEGYYRFDNLSAGKYKLVEVPSAGYLASDAEVNAVFNAGAWTGNAIEVTMPNPNLGSPVKIQRTPGIAGGYQGVDTAFTLAGGTDIYNSFSSLPYASNAHQFQVKLVAGDANTPVTPDFYTYCFDLFHIAPGYFGPYEVTPETVPQNLPPAVTDHLGEIGWLYNHHGKNLATSGADGAGLQLAFYELTYDKTVDLAGGNFKVNTATTDPAALAAARSYLALAAGRDERSIFLNTTDPVDTADYLTWGTQGLMTTESFNFINTPSVSLGDYVWLDGNGNGVQDAGENGVGGVVVNLLDASGTVIDSKPTAGNGSYLFDNLAPGTYSVQFVLPGGYAFTGKDRGGNDLKDSDADPATGRTATTTLAAGQSDLSLDAGLTVLPVSLGDYVWLDSNGNGVQDAGENGVGGVRVNLLNANGTAIDFRITSSAGAYLFDGLAPGTYSVQFVLPGGYAFTGKEKGGNDLKDSDADPATGRTATTTLAAGQSDLSLDAGLTILPASLGDYVWLDGNGNGVQDAGEDGVGGVTVRLLNASGSVIGTKQTASNGSYLFDGLAPGTYSVQFVLPDGYAFTGKDRGGNDLKDSDADILTGRTATTTLAAGQSDLSLDAGLTIVTGSISGTKFRDLTGNGLTADDTPLAGVKIYLDANNNGKPDWNEACTTTDANGNYRFTGLKPGKYTVREVVASGWIRTGPVLADNYVVNVTPGADAGDNDFANTETGCDCQISCVVYIINGCRQVSDLRGNVNQGDTVTARFTVRNASASNPAVFSLVSYTAPNSWFSAADAAKQEVYDMATGTYTTNGTYTLKIDVPDSFFQVDFVCGKVIDRFGPAGSNLFYTPQGRLISADNGGCGLNNNALADNDTGTADFWAGSTGQALIKGLNSGSTSKALGNWLASNFSNLYGKLAGKTNADVAAFMKSLNCSSSTQLEADILATALSVYVTDADLAGMNAVGYGFHVSFLGTAVKKASVGSAGSYLGLSNNVKYSVWTILDAADAKASNGVVLGSSSYGRSRVGSLFAGLNDAGSI